jgi:hypothetical protein
MVDDNWQGIENNALTKSKVRNARKSSKARFTLFNRKSRKT